MHSDMINGSLEQDVRSMAEVLRQEAKRKSALADHLERSILDAPGEELTKLLTVTQARPKGIPASKTVTVDPAVPVIVDLALIKSILRKGKVRPGDLVKRLGVSEHTIRSLVDPDDSGVRIGKQGWMTIVEPKKTEEDPAP